MYLDYIHPDKAGLQVFDWNAATQVFDRHIPVGLLIDINSPPLSETAHRYFALNCTTPKTGHRTYHFG